VAVAIEALLALALMATSSFGALLEFIGFTLSITAMLTVAGVVVLRAREPALARPCRTWGYPVTPVLFCVLSCWMAWRTVVERPAASLAGLGVVAGAALLHVAVARASRRSSGAALT
jgi:APA family basic amino acid/polyamine antiporter